MSGPSRTILYVGPDSAHADALEAFAARHGAPFHRLPPSYASAEAVAGARGRAARAAGQLLGRTPARYTEFLREQLAGLGPAIALGYWGTNSLLDLRTLGQVRPDIPRIAVMLCHPMALTRLRAWVQNRMLTRFTGGLAGVIYPSEAMQTYCAKLVRCRSIVVRPTWPAGWHAPVVPPEPGPNVIFLGRTDGGQASDDVRTELAALAAAGVTVHSTGSGSPPGPNHQYFPGRSLREIIPFAARFDVSLVTYNLAAVRYPARFENTIPDRLISSVAAGVPVALPAGGYAASEQYLADFPAVVRYQSPAELAKLLADRGRVRELRAAAQNGRGAYTAESTDSVLLNFLAHSAGGPS